MEKKHNIKKLADIKMHCEQEQKSQVHSKLNLNGSFITDKSAISSKFNDFFVNIGPNLAKKSSSKYISPQIYG